MANKNKRPPLVGGKENSSLGVIGQNAIDEPTLSGQEQNEHVQKRAYLKKNLNHQVPQRPQTSIEDVKLPASFRNSRSKVENKVFEYQPNNDQFPATQQSKNQSSKQMNQSAQNIDGVKKVKDFLMDQEVANFHSLQHQNQQIKPSKAHKPGNQTALDVRFQNEDLQNFVVAQELNTINYSNLGVVGRQKSRTRPDTMLQHRNNDKLPDQIKHEHAVVRRKSHRCKDIVGRKVGAPLIVTSQFKDDDMFNQERNLALDLIAANIGQTNGRKKSISPSARYQASKIHDQKRKLPSQNVKQKVPERHEKNEKAEKAKLSKSQDQMKQYTQSQKSKLNKLQSKKNKQVSLMDYLDASLQEQQTLNILTATADQLLQKKQRDKSKSVVAQSNAIRVEPAEQKKRSNERDKDRSLIQTKLLQFQRDASSKKRTNSNSLDRKKKQLVQKLQMAQDSSNSRSRSKDQLSRDASRDRSRSKEQMSRDAKKKQIKSQNLLAAARSKHTSAETVNINLRNMAFSNKKKSIDEQRSVTSHGQRKYSNYSKNQSLSPKTHQNLKPKAMNKSQNLLSANINLIVQNQHDIHKSAPGLKLDGSKIAGSIETAGITESLLDRDFILQEDSQTIFRNVASALDIDKYDRAKNSKSQNADWKLLQNPHQLQQTHYQLALKANKQGSQSPHRQDKSMQSLAKSGTSKIDKLIKENLKKQVMKEIEQKEKERQQKKETKKKRVELEQANAEIRKLNKEKVKRRQMMMMLQSNPASSQQVGLANTVGPNEKSMDRNLTNMLARSDKDEITNEMTKLLEQIDERPQPQKRNPSKKQPQLNTQKFDQSKLDAVEQIESLLEQQSYLASEIGPLETKAHNFDGQANQDSIVIQSNGDTQNFGNALIGLKQQKNKTKQIDEVKRDHRRSHGLDFLDVRKEILNELRQLGHKVKTKKTQAKMLKAQNLNTTEDPKPNIGYIQLRGSRSQRQIQELEQAKGNKICIKRPLINQKKVDSIFSQINREHYRQDLSHNEDYNVSYNEDNNSKKKKQFSLDISKLVERANIQQQQQNSAAPMKKELIRKFMKEKAKMQNEKVEKQKQQEIKKTLKVHANLLKLNNFCKKQLLNTTTTQANEFKFQHKITVPNTVMNKSNLKVRHRNIQQDRVKRSDLDEVTGNDLSHTPNRMLFEDSEPSLNVSGTRLSRCGLTNQHIRKEVSAKPQTRECDELYEDSKMQSMQTLEERPINSLGQHQRNKNKNKFSAGLAPCFEKSHSAKTLRAQFKKKSQSPPRIPNVNQSMVSIKVKTLQQPKKSKKQTKPQLGQLGKKEKRGKSLTKNHGTQTSKANQTNKLRVKIPNLRIKQRRRSSVATLQSNEESIIYERDRSCRKSSNKKARAAQVIQRETRNFLKRLGFYEAREILSPDVKPQIKMFIQKRELQRIEGSHPKATRQQSKGSKKSKSSKSRSGSRSSGGKRQPLRVARHRQQLSKNQSSPHKPISGRVSRKTTPDQKEPWRRSVLQHRASSKMQETTIIAELSGFKKRNLLYQDEHESEKSPEDIVLNLNAKHKRIESMQIMDSNYESAKTPNPEISDQNLSPDQIESDRLINLNQVQVLPQFSRMTFLDCDEESDTKKSSHKKKPKRTRDQTSITNLKQVQSSPPKDKRSPEKQPSKPKKTGKQQKPFNYPKQAQDVLQSESVSILDRLQGTTAANNFSKDEESNAFIPGGKQSLFDRQLPVLKEVSKDETSLWKENEKSMKSVQTPRSSQQIINLENRSHQSLSNVLKSASVSDNDIRRIQLSVESKRSSQNGHINDAVSQSSSSVFDRNAFQQFTNKQQMFSNKQENIVVQNNEYQKLIKFREDCLKLREHKEKKHIQKLLTTNQCSPRTYHAKKEQIDRWVNVEKMEIEKTKVTLQQEWDKTVKMIEETQKSVDQIKSRINIQSAQSNSNSVHNIAATSSLTSGQKQLQSSMSGSAKKPSILIEDPPKSYRSGQDLQVIQIDKNGALSSHRSATYGQAENLISYMEKRLGEGQGGK